MEHESETKKTFTSHTHTKLFWREGVRDFKCQMHYTVTVTEFSAELLGICIWSYAEHP